MLTALAIRDFVVVESIDVEFRDGFTVLTGETGAGKSILVDALGLLLGDRFDVRQLRQGAARAELSATFDIGAMPEVGAWLDAEGLAGDEGEVLLRRTLDAQGRSRAWINGHPATLQQASTLGERLVDLHGQHAHQALARAPAQRALVDAFGGFASLARETADAFRAWRAADAARDAARDGAAAQARERDALMERREELAALAPAADEWEALAATQSRLAHASALIDTAASARAALDGDDAIAARLAALAQRLRQAAQHDAALAAIAAAVDSAQVEVTEAARSLRDYLEHLDADPGEEARVEERLAALHDAARKHRVRPEALPELLAETVARLAALAAESDLPALEARAAARERAYRELAATLTRKRRMAATELSHRVTAAMQELAMKGGRFEARLIEGAEPASHGAESIEFDVSAHPAQPPGPLARVASGGELSRVALAIQVAASEVAGVPTLVFDEVDTGIGGAVAAAVGERLQSLAASRQVLCVTHLPQVAAHADRHLRVRKDGRGKGVATAIDALDDDDARVDELARMMSGASITDATRAHARELYAGHRRKPKARKAKRA
jgi:DNA repair protein RecN (Recombination protein N)